jgi:hypothetical protein
MDTEVQDKLSADKLVGVYIKMRDALEVMYKKYQAEKASVEEQMAMVEQELIDILKRENASNIKTPFGTASRIIKSKYWTNDWESFHKFMIEHEAPDLLEKRIHQSNMKTFLEDNPDFKPPGLNVENSYSIMVRRSNPSIGESE